MTIATATPTAAQVVTFEELRDLLWEESDARVLAQTAKAEVTRDTAKRSQQRAISAIRELIEGMSAEDIRTWHVWRVKNL